MSSIDDRIVNMQFNNSQFQQGIADTTKSLGDLKNGLKLDGATSGLDNVQQAANRFSLANIENALSNISSHFSVFGAIGFSAIQKLTNGVIDAGIQMGNSLIDPLVNGGERRALAIQLAQFQFRGLGLDVDKTMAVATAAVQKTAFTLDQAATAAAQFGASGITAGNGLEGVLRAVAGVAAQTGSDFGSVAQIFETVAGNGRLMGENLLQLSSRGVNAAAVLSKSMGITEADVRDMVSKGKISFQQFSDAMNAAFGANAYKANETFTGALDNMHAALARIGAEVQGPKLLALRDIFNELGPLFDSVHVSLKPFLTDIGVLERSSADNLIVTLKQIDTVIKGQLGTSVGTSLQNILKAVKAVGAAIEGAFKEIFPPATNQQLSTFAFNIEKLTAALIPGSKTADDIRKTFKGLFAILDIGVQIVSGFIGVIAGLFGYTAKTSSGFFAFTAQIGDFLVKVDTAIRKGGGLTAFFKTLGAVLAVPIGFIQTFLGVLGDGVQAMFNFASGGKQAFADFSNDVNKRFGGLIAIGGFFKDMWDAILKAAQAFRDFMRPILDAVGLAFQVTFKHISDWFTGLSAGDQIRALNTGIFGAFVLIVRAFFGNLGGIIQGNGVAFVTKFKTIMTALQVNLKALEINTNAKTLKQIAEAVALLALSAIGLSLVDSGKLTVALVAIVGMVKGLLLAFEAFAKIEGTKGILQAIGISIALTGIATAVLILSGAIAVLGALPMDNIIQGTVAIVVIIAALTISMKQLAKLNPDVVLAALAISLIAPSIVLLAGAVAILSAIPLAGLVDGLAAIGILMFGLVIVLQKISDMGPKVVFGALAIGILGISMISIATAIAILAHIGMDDLTKGLAGLSVALLLMVLSMNSMEGAAPGAAIMIISAAGIYILAKALQEMGKMTWDDIGRMFTVLAGGLILLAAAILVMQEGALGAVALIVTAAALAILVPPLLLLSHLSWDEIGRGMAVLGASLAILAVGGVLLVPAAVGFLLLGQALLLVGAGVFLAGAGVGLLAIGLAALTVVGTAAVGVFILAIKSFIESIPGLAGGIGEAIVAIADVIAKDAPRLINDFVIVLIAMLRGVDLVAPQIIETGKILMMGLIDSLYVLIPLLEDAGLHILEQFLISVGNHIEKIVDAALTIIANFINGLAQGLPGIIAAGGNLVFAYISGIAAYIQNNAQRFADAGSKLFRAIVDGVSDAITNGGADLRYAGKRIGDALIQGAKNALGINSPSKVFRDTIMGSVFEGIQDGNDKNISTATSVGKNIGTTIGTSALSGVKSSITGIGDAIQAGMDTTPTIRPIIDLTNITTGVKQMHGMFISPTLDIGATQTQAQTVSLQEEIKRRQLALIAPKDGNGGNVVGSAPITMIQNNFSPKALSAPEIYRQTQNQLSTVKGELGVVDQNRSA